MSETADEKAQRLEDAREAAAAALFDQYEKWNDRGFLTAEKAILCSTHNEENCRVCCPKPTRRKQK